MVWVSFSWELILFNITQFIIYSITVMVWIYVSCLRDNTLQLCFISHPPPKIFISEESLICICFIWLHKVYILVNWLLITLWVLGDWCKFWLNHSVKTVTASTWYIKFHLFYFFFSFWRFHIEFQKLWWPTYHLYAATA